MKKILILTFLTTTLALTSLGQGTVTFANATTSLFQYVDFSTGFIPAPMPVGGGRVELLWAPLGTTDLNMFQLLGAAANVTPLAGRFSGGTRTIPAGTGFSGIAPGASVSLVVRGWKGPYTTWNEAISMTFYCNYSSIFIVDTGDPTLVPAGVPASINGPGGFTGLIVGIPEPSSLALFSLGATTILWRRRK